MSDIRKAHDNYTTQTILKRIQEESDRTGESYETIKQSTDRIKSSLNTQNDISETLNTSKRQLFFMKITANAEDLFFKSGLLFYVLVILYIIVSRTIVSWFFSN
ncbi:hypothetical protein EHI8A_062920 [Entamoeba histolytica HM-1:IMSS-B]|uniref:Uncharacterized protein n=6 Tax=Entamoeba histolytica TaxID=5759 RepID=B1N2F3_ENTH1|nr:hypothetical protein EHI_151350 [Entamoeba histolytica HM-1:IMSS]EMD46654.1 Hypothetical protein EHI5A_091260 [Entamoeba histolytica KU27]EMH75615.1 hypothetical protein EHI8A_062920 [Entamoeba histolytica HM-1:IMSS-B]EMS17045.1 hypothetical protein KM1_109590 [Entamoeba histolytica HM-3:IMSS]ENY64950.1 hypothetical protein EHI7A_061050 [Entamoeba histolytica HM-1:IMSS-A]GAT91382.1 hypothetical protein CL6EHI_151350 [Entamoeba histolytica]|eukprot:XP_001913351.1 hypothetical protein EHI_151350 [Entamoeba histolytica HM-1:IMSS]